MKFFYPKNDILRARQMGRSRGQVVIEYLLMSLMLLFLFTGLYRVLQGQLKTLFTKAGVAILTAYYD